MLKITHCIYSLSKRSIKVLNSGYARETTYKCKPQTHGHDRVKLIQKTSPSFLFARQLITSNDKFLDHNLYERATSQLEERKSTSQVSFSLLVHFLLFSLLLPAFFPRLSIILLISQNRVPILPATYIYLTIPTQRW